MFSKKEEEIFALNITLIFPNVHPYQMFLPHFPPLEVRFQQKQGKFRALMNPKKCNLTHTISVHLWQITCLLCCVKDAHFFAMSNLEFKANCPSEIVSVPQHLLQPSGVTMECQSSFYCSNFLVWLGSEMSLS